MQHRRRALMVGAAILTAALLAACGAANLPAPTSGSENDPALAGCKPIYLVADAEESTTPFRLEAAELCRRFGVRPVLRNPPYLSPELDQFVEQSPDPIDLVIFSPSRLSVYVEKQLLQPVDKWIDEQDPWFTDILPAYRNLYMRYGGHYYGFVYDGDSHLLFYRKDLLDALGLSPPTTWTEHDRIARELAKLPGEGGSRAYGMSYLASPGKAYMYFAERFAANGGEYFGPNMRPEIDGLIGIRALTDMIQILKDAGPEATYDWADLNKAFLAGTLPMVVQFSDTARFSYDPSIWKSKVRDLVGWTLVPGQNPGAPRGGIWYGRIIGITARSTMPEVAAKVAKYMTSGEVSAKMVVRADTINDPFRYSHFEHPEWQILLPDLRLRQDFYKTLLKALEHPMADLTIPGGWEYTQALDRAVVRALQGEQTPEAALSQAASEWEAITERYGRAEQSRAYQDWLKRLSPE